MVLLACVKKFIAIRGVSGFLLVLLFLNAAKISGQSLSTKYLGIENGLSNNAVTSIYRDQQGFMWFGTYDGLNRYDGYQFTIYRNIIGDSTSIAFNNVYTITEDAGHNLWIGGQKGVNIFSPVLKQFQGVKYFPSGAQTPVNLTGDVYNIAALNAETVLIGTKTQGLIVYSLRDKIGHQVKLPAGAVNYNVRSIVANASGSSVYMFIQGEGLFLFNLQTEALSLVNNALKRANVLYFSRSGLWVGDTKGLHKFNLFNNTVSASYLSQPANVTAISEDLDGALWVATDGNGVFTLPLNGKTATPLVDVLKKPLVNSNAVYAIYPDEEGRKWIGTLRGGVNVVQPHVSAFKLISNGPSTENDLIDNFILSFCEDDNNVWIGTDGAGLRLWNRTNNTFTQYREGSKGNSLSSNFITCVTRDFKKDVWIATWYGGICKFNKATNSFKQYKCFNPKTGGFENNIWQIYQDKRQRLWASATNDGTLYLYNRQADRFEQFDNRLVNLQSFAEDKDGNLWAGNYTSLIKIDTVHKQHVIYTLGYSVRSIHEDYAGNFWLGTQDAGLLAFNKNTAQFRAFTTKEGLPNNSVLRILEDGQKNLWLSTFNGLSKFDLLSTVSTNYYKSDGLQSNQFSFNAATKLSTGEFLFGGIKGFNIFYPDSVPTERENAKLYLSDVTINNKHIQQSAEFITDSTSNEILEITVPYNQAALSLDYLVLKYFNTGKIKYAYNLEGWDKSWNYANEARTANYSRLNEGQYSFKVKASFHNNVWSQPATLLRIVVLPPWYRTWWAYLLYLFAGFGAIYVYVFYKNRQTDLKYQVQYAKATAEKEKELNEKKILFFTNISHEFRTPLSLIINPLKDILSGATASEEDANLGVVYRNARRLLRLADQLLLFNKADSFRDTLHYSQVNVYTLGKEVFSCFVQEARSKKIEFKFTCDDDFIIIAADREKLEIALYNLLSNAFKYTQPNGRITFTIKEQKTGVLIYITDSGAGIPAHLGDKIFERFFQAKDKSTQSGGFGIGLYLVKNFVEAHGGKVTYSCEGIGTTFQILLHNNLHLLDFEQVCEPTHSLPLQAAQVVPVKNQPGVTPDNKVDDLITDQQTLLIVDDDLDTVHYLATIFTDFRVLTANDGSTGLQQAREHLPDLIISDVVMQHMNGIDFCKNLKEDPNLNHIPLILVTGSYSEDVKLEGIESGADDYIKKPFDNEQLIARVRAILKSRTTLQKYFYNEVTLQSNNLKVSAEYKEFLKQCISIVESHLDDDNFSIGVLASEIGTSHSNLYKKIKFISGLSASNFIRLIRLRKAAQLFINSDLNVNQTAFAVGINDVKYFRGHFNKVFNMNPSEYIKKFRNTLSNTP